MQQVLIDKAEYPQRKRIAQHIMHFFVYFAQQNVHFWYFFTVQCAFRTVADACFQITIQAEMPIEAPVLNPVDGTI